MKSERCLLSKQKSNIYTLYKFILIITMVLGLTSCSLPIQLPFMYSPPNEKQQVEQQEKLVLDTINTKDISKIKGLFSKSALAKIDDIDGKLKEFLDFYSGEYVSSKYSCPIGDNFDNGDHTKSFYFSIAITTDKDIYVIACTDTISSSKNPDEVGISRLAIIRKEDASSSTAWHSGSNDDPEVKCFYKNDEKGQKTK